MDSILEATKRELIQKSEEADKVKAYNSTRYERRKYQKVASLQKDYNDFDMDALFKGKRVTLNIGVKGETDNYVVKVSWDNLLDLIKERVKLNKGKWDLKCAYLALLKSFNESNVYISCTCLQKDTKINLLDGTIPTVEELKNRFDSGEQLWVYSVDSKGDFKPGKVTNVIVTGQESNFIKITLDNGKSLMTTENHLYMLRDGTYTESKNLQPGDSLMPLYFNNVNGYDIIKLNSEARGWRAVYKLVANELYSDLILEKEKQATIEQATGTDKMSCKVAIHHKDFNKSNNNPENLQIMTAWEHWMYHANHINRLWNDPKFREESSNRAREWMTYLNANPTEKMKTSRALSGRRLAACINIEENKQNQIDKRIAVVIQRILSNGEVPSPETYKKYKKHQNPDWTKWYTTWEDLSNKFNLNHKVVSVEKITINNSEPVYDISVDTWHNFLVDSSVILHNCADWKFRFSYYATVNDYNSGAPEVRVSDITNPNDTKGAGCKHTMAVLTEGGIFMKLAICITNYVNYMQKTHPDLYQDIIVPAIYGSGRKPEYSLEDTDELEKPLNMKPDRPEFKVDDDDEFIPFNVEEE